MDRLKQHALNTKCQALCLVFYMFYDSTVIATHEIIITFCILGNWAKERSRKLHKVTQVETGLYLIPKPILLTITILKKLSHHQDHCALSKDKHYLRRMVCLESRQEKHEHFRVVSPQPREEDSSHSWPEQSGLPGDTSLEWDWDAEVEGPCSHPPLTVRLQAPWQPLGISLPDQFY